MTSEAKITLSDEQQMLADSVDKYLHDNYSFEARSQLVGRQDKSPTDHWKNFAEMGWLALPFPEEQGGFDGDAVDLMVLFEKFGAHLLLDPYLETVVLAGTILQHASESIRSRYIDRIIDGSLQAAFAHSEPPRSANPFYVATRASKNAEGWVLNGKKAVVVNAPSSDMLIVSARVSGNNDECSGIGYFVVDSTAAGIFRQEYVTNDGRWASDIQFKNLQVSSDAYIAMDVTDQQRLFDLAVVAQCAEAVGAMQSLIDATVDYCAQRKQFGQPISKFQVLQHRMVDMYIAIEMVRSLLEAAARAMETNSEDASRLVSALKYRVSKSARYVGQSAIQLHGGIAMTDELNVGHYFKKLSLIEYQFGSPDYHLCKFIDTGATQNI